MIVKERGKAGWVFVLVMRVPVWWRRYTRTQKAGPRSIAEPASQSKAGE